MVSSTTSFLPLVCAWFSSIQLYSRYLMVLHHMLHYFHAILLYMYLNHYLHLLFHIILCTTDGISSTMSCTFNVQFRITTRVANTITHIASTAEIHHTSSWPRRSRSSPPTTSIDYS